MWGPWNNFLSFELDELIEYWIKYLLVIEEVEIISNSESIASTLNNIAEKKIEIIWIIMEPPNFKWALPHVAILGCPDHPSKIKNLRF